MARQPIFNGSGHPAEDTTLAGVHGPTPGQWVRIDGQPHVNAIVRAASFTGTLKLEGSMTGQGDTVDGELSASLTTNSTLANRIEFAGFPFVRINPTVVAVGQIDRAFIYGYGAT